MREVFWRVSAHDVVSCASVLPMAARPLDPDNGPAKLLNVKVSLQLMTDLNDLADISGVTRSQIIRRMLAEGLERELQASA